MKLYDSHRAPNPRRVRWVMAEKGITDVEIVQASADELGALSAQCFSGALRARQRRNLVSRSDELWDDSRPDPA